MGSLVQMKKPKLILHVGHSKTGTTSLQNYLYRNSAELLKAGYLYPTRKSVRNNHILLSGGFLQATGCNLPHNLTYNNNFNLFEKDFKRFWNALMEDVEEHSPETVILSCEWYFTDFTKYSRISLCEFLGKYFSTVTLVAYIRSPAPDYLSRLAQRIRTANPVPVPGARQIRATIEYYQTQFPGCVQVHPFDRRQLRGGDILHDFISRYIPEALPAIAQLKHRPFNASLPWPLLRALQKIRELAQSGSGLCTYSTRARIDWAAADYLRLHPDEKKYDVRLQTDVEAYIRSSAVDYLWLKEQFGVEFPDLDYAQIESVPCPYAADIKLDRIVDFSQCPQNDFPLDRYLGNGPRLWITCMLLILRLKFHRVFRAYLRDTWLLSKIRTSFLRSQEA